MISNHIAVYIPGTTGSKILPKKNQDAIAARAAKLFSKRFGGCTRIPAIGSWVDDSGQLISEKIIIVKSFYSCDSTIAYTTAARIARAVKSMLFQQAVSIESNEGIDFI